MCIGSARVSTGDDQDPRAQIQALRAAGVARLFTKHASGGRWDRAIHTDHTPCLTDDACSPTFTRDVHLVHKEG